MRIYGNRLLKTLPGQDTRPTTAKVRAALFNIWQGQITDCRWLDICAGNGSMAAEALCRGAKQVVAIEKNGRACSIIKQNFLQVATSEQEFTILKGDISKILPNLQGQQFDFIYFDPPYHSNLYQPVLSAIAHYQLLTPEGEIAVEHDPKLWQNAKIEGLTICREKIYGNTNLTFYQLSR